MKIMTLLGTLLVFSCGSAMAQGVIYNCPNISKQAITQGRVQVDGLWWTVNPANTGGFEKWGQLSLGKTYKGWELNCITMSKDYKSKAVVAKSDYVMYSVCEGKYSGKDPKPQFVCHN